MAFDDVWLVVVRIEAKFQHLGFIHLMDPPIGPGLRVLASKNRKALQQPPRKLA